MVEGIKKYLERKKGESKLLKKQVKTHKKEILSINQAIIYNEQAHEILKEVGLQTQRQLQFHISDITSLALDAVFPDPYELKVDFVERRNTTECDLTFERDGNTFDPLDSSGYGPVDIASFALRVVSWILQTPQSRNTIILDEPFRFLSKEYREPAAKMVKELSDKLGIQFIIITHDPVLTQYADKVIEVKLKNGKSIVK